MIDPRRVDAARIAKRGVSSALASRRRDALDYVDCRVPEWRISTTEPVDLEQGPEIPANAEWRLF